MDRRNELERIEANNELASMPAIPLEFDVNLGGFPEEILARVLYVVHEIARHDADDWPSDDGWRAILPDWLKQDLPELTQEECDRLLASTPREQWHLLPWEFGSWLDAIRDRGWKWWGYKRDGSEAKIVLHIAMFPERIDAFKQILKSAGVEIEN